MESRLRAAENELSALKAASAKGHSLWAIILPTLMSAASLIVAILSLVRVWGLR